MAKLKLSDIILVSLIAAPLIILGILVYNPAERFLIKEDNHKKDIISSLGRASALYKNKNGIYPDNPGQLVQGEVLDWLPENPEEYIFESRDGELVIYTLAQSMKNKEFCHSNDTFIVYSSSENKTGISCSIGTSEIDFI